MNWKRAAIALSLFANALVILAIFVLWFRGPGLFREYILDPMMERERTQFEMLGVAPGAIVMLGDSITAGGQWSELLADAPVPVLNRGIGGDTTRGVLARLDTITAGRPSQLFLKIGTNDLGMGEDAGLLERYGTLLDRIAAESPTTEVIVQSVLPRGIDYRERVETLNAGIQALAAERGLTYVDLYTPMLDDDGSIRDELANDELHLLAPGYALWVEAIGPLVGPHQR